MGEFGDKFRKAREKKELSLDDVSNVTKISARMLRAIEEEHFDDLPGGVFNKGFIRAYAKHLGLDAEEAVSDYLISLRQAQIDAQEVWEPQSPGAVRAGANGGNAPKEVTKPAIKDSLVRSPAPVEVEELPDLQLPRAEHVRGAPKEYLNDRPGGTPWRIVVAGALVLGLGIFLWVRHSSHARTAFTSTPNVASGSLAQPLQSGPVSSASMQNTTSPPPPTPKPTAPPAAVQEPVKSSPTAELASPSAPASDSHDVSLKNSIKAASKGSAKSAPSLSLEIRATENSWVSAFADGQLVTQETLIAPAHTAVRASREISIRIGNAAGVTFVLNGKEIPIQGAEGEVKNFIFDSSGMHDSAPTGAIP
jgi:cytoskeleton protein RodZ